MAISTGKTLQGIHNRVLQLGHKLINADFALGIEGFEGLYALAKQCPWPEYSSGGEIEVPGPLGMAHWQSQQAKSHQQGAIALMETEAGQIEDMIHQIMANGGYFNAKIYQGTPDAYSFYKPVYDCFLQLDPVDRDHENRSQVLIYNGTLFYHYFGERVKGNA